MLRFASQLEVALHAGVTLDSDGSYRSHTPITEHIAQTGGSSNARELVYIAETPKSARIREKEPFLCHASRRASRRSNFRF